MSRTFDFVIHETRVGTPGDDILPGDWGNDTLDGLAGMDILDGGDGADTILGGDGADTNIGGTGFDTIDYSLAPSLVRFDATTSGTHGWAAGDTYSGFERYYGSSHPDQMTTTSGNEFIYGQDGNDLINAGDGLDRLYGGNGNDILRGQGGNDTLYGDDGNDQLNGGTGFDIANYSDAPGAVIVDLSSSGTLGWANGDTYFGIDAVYGSDLFADTLTGNTGINELRGLGGNDVLNGGGGNDRLHGGEGADTLNGDSGIDGAYYTAALSGVTVNLAGIGTGGEALGDTYTSIENVFGSNFADSITGDALGNKLWGYTGVDILVGGAGNDRLLGGNDNDTLFGGDGVDFLYGQDGDDMQFGGNDNDFFFGGSGADTHDGGGGIDTVSYVLSSTGITVDMAAAVTSTTDDATGDTYISIERIFGSVHADNITGAAGNERLYGRDGADYIEGGQGNDLMDAGVDFDVDTLAFNIANGGSDSVWNFNSAHDIIDIIDAGSTFTSLSDITAGMLTNLGSDVRIDFGGGNLLLIKGYSSADILGGTLNFNFRTFAERYDLKDFEEFGSEIPNEIMSTEAYWELPETESMIVEDSFDWDLVA